MLNIEQNILQYYNIMNNKNLYFQICSLTLTCSLEQKWTNFQLSPMQFFGSGGYKTQMSVIYISSRLGGMGRSYLCLSVSKRSHCLFCVQLFCSKSHMGCLHPQSWRQSLSDPYPPCAGPQPPVVQLGHPSFSYTHTHIHAAMGCTLQSLRKHPPDVLM